MVEKIAEIKGSVLQSGSGLKIFEGFPYYYYEIQEKRSDLKSEKVRKALSEILSRKAPLNEIARAIDKSIPESGITALRGIIGKIESEDLLDSLPTFEQMQKLKEDLSEFLEKFAGIEASSELAENVLDDSIGFGELSVLIKDAELEEIMVNSLENIFVFHRAFGMCKTNVSIAKPENLSVLVRKIAKRVGKVFDANNPLLDARLPDGNRANATFGYVTPFGMTLTIRKFKKEPLTIIDLIINGTLNAEVAAFLWVMVEGLEIEPMNIIVAGGTTSGKTTTLNCLAQFLRYRNRIITIEDTLELQLGDRENWIRMEARLRSSESREISMDDLLKNSLRMRPDRILVGEVRGSEAQTMFVAMDTGHKGLMGTLHANNAKETLIRLKSEPMAVPEAMLPLLDLIVVQYRQYAREKGLIRRIYQVTEVSRMNEQVLLSNIFEWDRAKDEIRKTDVPARVLETLSEKAGITKKELMREIAVRQKILEWMTENSISKQTEVEKIIQGYYYNPKYILEKIAEGISSRA